MKAILCLVVVLLAASCMMIRGSRCEPAVILIRNRSGADIADVQLSESRASEPQARRVASVSHIPRGVTQSIGRADDALPLPPRARVVWTDGAGRTFAQHVDIGQLLAAPTDGQPRWLVFELLPDGHVRVTLTDPDPL